MLLRGTAVKGPLCSSRFVITSGEENAEPLAPVLGQQYVALGALLNLENC